MNKALAMNEALEGKDIFSVYDALETKKFFDGAYATQTTVGGNSKNQHKYAGILDTKIDASAN